MRHFRLQILLVFLLAVICSFPVYAQDKTTGVVQEKIDKVKLQVSSDKRISVFDVKVSETGKKLEIKGEVSHPFFFQVLKDSLDSLKIEKKIEYKVIILPDSKMGRMVWGIVNKDVAKLHRETDPGSEQLSQAILGDIAHILKKKDSWVYVQLEDGYLGWMPEEWLVKGPEDKVKDWKKGSQAIITSMSTPVYDNTDVHKNTLRNAVVGTVLPLEEVTAYWWKVRLPDGMPGWIPAGNVKKFSYTANVAEPTPEQIIGTAVRFLGIKYLWGGLSSKGCDCSGFVQTVFKLNGIRLLRDSNMQAITGTRIEPGENLKNLKMGDLVFFGRNRVTHVGIYINDGFFIHSSGWVRINNLLLDKDGYNPGRARTLRHACRILK